MSDKPEGKPLVCEICGEPATDVLELLARRLLPDGGRSEPSIYSRRYFCAEHNPTYFTLPSTTPEP